MKSKIVALFMASVLVLSGCSSQKAAETAETDTPTEEASESPADEEEEEAPTEEETADGAEDASAEGSSLGNIEVEEDLFDVNLTIPADFVGETSQEALDAEAAEYGYTATLNDDGSVTYVMTKSQHQEMLKELAAGFDAALAEMVGSEDYPNITDIEASSDYSSFTVTTTNTELDMAESVSVIAFYMYGGLYGIFNGDSDSTVTVTFVNADSGETIYTSNSSEM